MHASCCHSIAFLNVNRVQFFMVLIPSFTDACNATSFKFWFGPAPLQGERWLIIQIAHESWVMGEFFFLFFQKKIYLCELETKDWKKSTSEAKESPNENNWVFQASTSQNGTVNSKWLDLAQNRLFLVIWSLPICSYLITTKLGQKHSLMVISTTPCELFISYKMLCRFYHLKNM